MKRIDGLYNRISKRIDKRDEWNDNNNTFLSDEEYAKALPVLDIFDNKMNHYDYGDMLDISDEENISAAYAFFIEMCEWDKIDISDITPEQFCLALITLE